MPFRLALPLFPTDSDVLAALVLVEGVAMLSMLLASLRGQQFLEGAAMNTRTYSCARAREAAGGAPNGARRSGHLACGHDALRLLRLGSGPAHRTSEQAREPRDLRTSSAATSSWRRSDARHVA